MGSVTWGLLRMLESHHCRTHLLEYTTHEIRNLLILGGSGAIIGKKGLGSSLVYELSNNTHRMELRYFCFNFLFLTLNVLFIRLSVLSLLFHVIFIPYIPIQFVLIAIFHPINSINITVLHKTSIR